MHREKTAIDTRRENSLSFAAYGLFAAYFGYLFLTDFWHGYQPAWQAYSVIFIVAFSIVIFLRLQRRSDKHIRDWIGDLFTSGYSFTVSIIAILAGSLIFPILAIEETKKVIEYYGDRNIKHCIQTR